MKPTLIAYAILLGSIVSEVVGTTFLASSEQFTKPLPTFLMAICYLLSFFLLSIAIKTIPLGIAYACWGGIGIVLTMTVGAILFKQIPDSAALLGTSMIVCGVVIANVFSKTTGH